VRRSLRVFLEYRIVHGRAHAVRQQHDHVGVHR
jgi:hypothetical protein